MCGVGLLTPGLGSLPPIDRDESRFAEASRRMAVSDDWRDWVAPRIDDRLRLNKPPLIYWLQAASVRLFGVEPDEPAQPRLAHPAWEGELPARGIWAYRLPSTLGAILAGLLLWRLGTRLFAPPTGLLAGLLLMACLVVLVDARQARIDQMLLACTTAAYLLLLHAWRAARSDRPISLGLLLALWGAVAIGVLLKGPILPATLALSILALSSIERRWRWVLRLRPLLGSLVVLVIVGPWLGAVISVVGLRPYFEIAILNEIWRRGTEPLEGHWGPPGYYAALSPILFWPGSLALAPAFVLVMRRGLRFSSPPRREDDRAASPREASNRTRLVWPRIGNPRIAFALCWLVPGWIMFEAAGTKLPHYVLPLLPALALLTSRALLGGAGWWRPLVQSALGRAALTGYAVLTAFIVLAAPLIVALSLPLRGGWYVLTPLLALALTLIVAFAAALRRQAFVRAQLLALGGAFALSWSMFGVVLPRATDLWISPRLIDELAKLDPNADRPLAAVAYREDSLRFLWPGELDHVGPVEIDAWLAENPRGLLIVAAEPLFRVGGLRPLVDVEGYNYSKGAWERLQIAEASQSRPHDQ